MAYPGITVDFNKQTNNITINNKDVFNITKIRNIYDGVTNITGDADMITQQQVLNYLDSIKDGTNVVTLQQVNLYPSAYTNMGYPSYPKDLHTYENNIKQSLKPYISNITWTKLKKKQELNQPLPIKNIFRDCGIGANVFIESGFNLFSTFASYIDPATRAIPTNVWPESGKSIMFSKTVMELFGLPNSSINSKTVNKTRFNYDIMTNGIQFTNNGIETDKNLNYFSGNTNKNSLLKGTKTPLNQKKALISLKEWGDKMQVVMLFIWIRENTGKTYAMITCDKVVYTLCLLLGVKCVFTGEIKEGNVKKYSIEIYEPSANPKADAINRYNDKKKSIVKENNAFISMINLLRLNPSQSIYVDGVTDPYTFKQAFYQNIYNDILGIQTKLNQIPMLTQSTTMSVSDIEMASKKLAADFLLITFIKKIRGNIKITRAVKYTYTQKVKPSFKGSVNSFLNIAKQQSYIINVNLSTSPLSYRRTLGGGVAEKKATGVVKAYSSPIIAKGKPMLKPLLKPVDKASRVKNIPEVINAQVFEDSDFYQEPIMYDYYVDSPVAKEVDPSDQLIDFVKEEKQIDLNSELYNQVSKIVTSNKQFKFIDSIYSMILFYAYLNDGIALDYDETNPSVSNLKFMVDIIIQDELELPSTTYAPPQTVIPATSSIASSPSQPNYQTVKVGTGGTRNNSRRSKKRLHKRSNRKAKIFSRKNIKNKRKTTKKVQVVRKRKNTKSKQK